MQAHTCTWAMPAAMLTRLLLWRGSLVGRQFLEHASTRDWTELPEKTGGNLENCMQFTNSNFERIPVAVGFFTLSSSSSRLLLSLLPPPRVSWYTMEHWDTTAVGLTPHALRVLLFLAWSRSVALEGLRGYARCGVAQHWEGKGTGRGLVAQKPKYRLAHNYEATVRV